MKFIRLPEYETRCKPVPPNTIRHNDCGAQGRCARALAACTKGEPKADLSRDARAFVYNTMTCKHFLSTDDAARLVSKAPVKEWVRG